MLAAGAIGRGQRGRQQQPSAPQAQPRGRRECDVFISDGVEPPEGDPRSTRPVGLGDGSTANSGDAGADRIRGL